MSEDGSRLVLTLNGDSHELSRQAAASLRDSLCEALTRREEFFRTAGEHRDDGSYVVSRRAADSAGHSKVFRSFRELERLYDQLPEEFTAAEVGRTGLTGGRRHVLLRHFAEHPRFDCELVKRQPLTARKRGVDAEDRTAVDPPKEEALPAD
ncbi:DUF7528 family protein [Halegenticoccus tardaugens]|uniref:DUF7528 family protein n=1 Tax=Halegenticoccus tardaugens TaxID=2071624 RepID=UPI001E4811D3|nr:hypothetical protein [Halegenticoccus tardaugens]